MINRIAISFLAPLLTAALAASLISGCGGSSLGSATSTSASRAANSTGGTGTASHRAESGPRPVAQHAGLAFGVFRSDVYKPFRAGTLSNARRHRAAVARARAALALALREVARAKAAATRTTALRKLFIPLGALQATLSGLRVELKHGRASAVAIQSAYRTIAAITAAGSAEGLKIFAHTSAAGG